MYDQEKLIYETNDIMKSLSIPGMSIACSKEGEIIWSQALGYNNIDKKLKTSFDTCYFIGSITKVFTSIILLQYVEEEKMSLDDYVNKYGLHMSAFNSVTIRNLMTHTSRGTPGDNFNYSDNRFSMLQKVIMNVSDYSLYDQFQKRIINPLKMNDTIACTMINHKAYSSIRERLSTPYITSTGHVEETNNPTYFGANDGLVSAPNDIMTLLLALDGEALLKNRQNLLLSNQKTNTGELLPLSLVCFIQVVNGEKIAWHFGCVQGFSALIIKAINKRMSFVILANNDSMCFPFHLEHGNILGSPIAQCILKYIQDC